MKIYKMRRKNSYILRLEKSNDKNLLVFDQYEVYLVPSSLSFEILKMLI